MAHRLTHLIRSNAVLVIAALVAVSVSSAWAATTAPKNSVVSKSIKNGQVKKKDIAKQAVGAKKVKPNSLTGAQVDEASLNSNVLQRRIADACPSGQALTAVASNGKITCTATGGPPSGSAGGDLSGTYPSPQIAPGAVSTAKLTDLAVITAKLAEHAVTGDKVAHDTLTGTNIDESSLGNVPSATDAGTLDGIDSTGFLQTSDSAGGALAGTYPNPVLNVSGGPCPNGKAMTGLSAGATITCGVGVFSDDRDNMVVTPNPVPALGFGADGGNTAMGSRALLANDRGTYNSAFGSNALPANAMGSFNSAFGSGALLSNSSGLSNTAVGLTALRSNATGSYNTAVGVNALQESTGNRNVAIGYAAGLALTTGDHNINIDNTGCTYPCTESGTIRIGTPGVHTRTFIAGIRGTTTDVNDAVPVLIDSAGQLGTASSSRRYKEDIQTMGAASDPIMDLRPVTFRYRQDPSDLRYGLVAEQVARVMPALAVFDDGRPETVKYQDLPVLLLNEVQQQQQRIKALEEQNRRQNAQIKWLTRQAHAR